MKALRDLQPEQIQIKRVFVFCFCFLGKRQTDRETDIEIDRQRERERERDRQTDRQTDRNNPLYVNILIIFYVFIQSLTPRELLCYYLPEIYFQ